MSTKMFNRSKQNNIIRIFAGALAMIMAVASAFCADNIYTLSARADLIEQMQAEEAETQNAISNLEKQTAATKNAINSLEQQKAESEKNAKNLQAQSANLKSTYNAYSNQLDDLSIKIADTEEKLAKTSGEIVALNKDLMANQKASKELYEKLKMQIRMSYEKKINNSMVLSLLESKSLRDFLTRAEYITAIVVYQQKLLKDYHKVEEDIKAQTAVLEEKQSELDGFQSELDEKQGEIADLADTVAGELGETNNVLASEKSKIAEYNNQLTELDKQMKALESQVAEAQARLAQQIAARLAAGNKEDTSGTYYASGSELEWLAATIQAEAGGESYTGKLAVGSVIMNRVMSSNFPNTIQGVITQNMQFASYRSGKVELIMSRGPNSTCRQAAEEVLAGARVGDYLFFMTKKWADHYRILDYTMIGNHAFFYRWETKPKEEAPVVEEQPQEAPAEQPAEQPVEEQPAEQPAEEQPQEAPAEETSSEEQPSE